MRSFLGASAVLFLAAHAATALDPPPDARTALDRYYAHRLNRPFLRMPNDPDPVQQAPPWEQPVKRLASGNPADRRAAAAYLRDLLALTLADETSGQAPWRNTPYWGGGADLPARDLRRDVADELAKSKPPAEALPVLKWYFDHERVDRFLPPVAAALGKLDGAGADALRVELVSKPHPNAAVVRQAIKQFAARKTALPAEALAALCQHHRASVRDAARALHARQGGPDPGAFDPAKAVPREPVAVLMGRMLTLMPDLPGADAGFVTVTVRYRDDKKAEREKHEESGWLVRKADGVVEIYIPHGRMHAFRDREKTKVWLSEKTADGVKGVEIDAVTDVSVAAADVAALVKDVAGARTKGDAGTTLSERGGLTGQFRGSGATLYEAILGAWLYRAGRDAEAAAVLLPALDSLYRDEHLALVVRDQMGDLAGQRMLVAFVGDRDYPAAVRHAKRINDLYPDTRFHEYAKGLAAQLPKRADDFTKFKLPTPSEWAALKTKLTRDQQIDYLCGRLRLLNCFQMGQPGGYDPGETQYAEPCGLSENAAWGGGKGKTAVINPFVELTGYTSWRAKDEPRPKGLELTLKDVPRLSTHLRDDWYMPIVSFGRDFAPDRHLSNTREEVASVINGLARKDLCRADGWDRLTPAEIDREIGRINAWAAANAGKTPEQLDWDALEEDVTRGEWWGRVEGRVEKWFKAKDPRADPLIRRTLAKADTPAGTRASILDFYRRHDAKGAKDLALPFLTAADPGLRLAAALLVFEAGDRAAARPVLGAIVEDGPGWKAAAEALLRDDAPEARTGLARLTRNGRLAGAWYGNRPKLLARLAAAGLKEPYAYYLKLLDLPGNKLPVLDRAGKEVSATEYGVPIVHILAREIVTEFAPGDPAVKDIARRFPDAKDQVGPLREWLRAKRDAKADPGAADERESRAAGPVGCEYCDRRSSG
jgi:hypothetical protein